MPKIVFGGNLLMQKSYYYSLVCSSEVSSTVYEKTLEKSQFKLNSFASKARYVFSNSIFKCPKRTKSRTPKVVMIDIFG